VAEQHEARRGAEAKSHDAFLVAQARQARLVAGELLVVIVDVIVDLGRRHGVHRRY
jgi:hypothetical protein